ncbi:MAG: gliding motility protein GldN [Bacteroidales bacterium]|jgi:gliding motility associated protien GldN|nr:gliding motility protein GldN [Bacteroidales bacterium]MDI9575344.1 gliding motility protein GldN [Bacteroidota bacterium]MDY0401433.1 gliding motility protein GldN [Bacteroidales bacterium]HHW59122.1 gliding motility protein GldN [Bacteroidales bacterium]HOB77438.1 gliding motility protein GldN [Bacteroidales bacterium]
MKYLSLIVTFLILSVITLQGQVIEAPTDGAYEMDDLHNRVPVPYQFIHESDVLYAKRIWREIDMREKINHPLYYPIQPTNRRYSLMSVIMIGVQEGGITPFSPESDDFKVPMTKETVQNIIRREETTKTYDPFTGEERDTVIVTEFDPSTVTRYRLKEDWIFDKNRSVLDVRIIGILPLMVEFEPDGITEKGTRPLFWISFAQLRPYLVRYEYFNRKNDGQRLTYDDAFNKRMFGSYIIKESNVYDRYISSYTTGIDALLESERIKNDIFIFEHDLWEY